LSGGVEQKQGSLTQLYVKCGGRGVSSVMCSFLGGYRTEEYINSVSLSLKSGFDTHLSFQSILSILFKAFFLFISVFKAFFLFISVFKAFFLFISVFFMS